SKGPVRTLRRLFFANRFVPAANAWFVGILLAPPVPRQTSQCGNIKNRSCCPFIRGQQVCSNLFDVTCLCHDLFSLALSIIKCCIDTLLTSNRRRNSLTNDRTRLPGIPVSLQIGYRYRGPDPWSVELDQRIRLPEELSLRKELRLCTFRSHTSIYAFQAAPLHSF